MNRIGLTPHTQEDGISLISASDEYSTIIDGSNSGTVLFLIGLNSEISNSTRINGFTIRGGNAALGAGISMNNASPRLKNVIVTQNNATTSAAGINCVNGSNPRLTDCIVEENIAASDAGGIYMHMSTVTLNNVLVRNNHSNNHGGGLFVADGGVVEGSDIFILGNSSGQGGGVFTVQADGVMDSLQIVGNSAGTGGGLYCDGSDNVIAYTNILRNTATEHGGGVRIFGTRTSFEHINVSENYADVGYNGFYLATGEYTDISNSNIFNNGTGAYSANTWDAINNWWGSDDGPSHSIENPGGTGDTVNFYLSVDPWLTSPNTDAPPIAAQNLTVTGNGNDFIQLRWDASPMDDFAGFKLYYDSDQDGYPYANSVNVNADTSYTLTALSPSTTYFLAVTTYDSDGNESWFSSEVIGATRIIEVHNLDIAGDEELSHLITHDPIIAFEYFDSLGEIQTAYQAQISTDSTFSGGDTWETGIISTDVTTIQYDGEMLENGTTYHLRVKVASGDFWSEWATLAFRMNTEPSSPDLVSPLNGEIVTTQPTLRFLKSSDVENDVLSYSVYIYNSEEMVSPLDSLINYVGMTDTIRWTVSVALDDNAQHWWKVNSYDGYEYNNLSEV